MFLFPLERLSPLTVLLFHNLEGVQRFWCIWFPNREIILWCVSKFFSYRAGQDLASTCFINNKVGNLQSLYDLGKKKRRSSKNTTLVLKCVMLPKYCTSLCRKLIAETEGLQKWNVGIWKIGKIYYLVLVFNWKIPSLWNRRYIQL